MNIQELIPLFQMELDGKITRELSSQTEEIPEGGKGKSFDWHTISFASKDNFDIEMIDKKSFFDDKQHGWLWYKNLNIPTLKFKHTSLLRSSRELNVQLYAIRKSEKSWSEVPLKGTMGAQFSQSSSISQLNSLRFSDTSYNYKGSKFVLIIAFFENVTNINNHSDEAQEEVVDDENVKRLLQQHNQRLLCIKISPPIYVESRKKSYQERQNKIKFYEPFQPEMITKPYSKGKGQAVIQNTIDDLHTYFTTATIRHKDDRFFYDTQKEIFSNLFGTSADTSDEPLLLMCLKKQKKQEWPKDIQKIDKFLSNIESTALSYLESTDYPFQIPEEYSEIVYSEQLRSIYTKSYNQISNLQFQMQSQRANNQPGNLLYQQQCQELLNHPQVESSIAATNSLSGSKISPSIHSIDTDKNQSNFVHSLYQMNPSLAGIGKIDDKFDANAYQAALNHKRKFQDLLCLNSNGNGLIHNNTASISMNNPFQTTGNNLQSASLENHQNLHQNFVKSEDIVNQYANASSQIAQNLNTNIFGVGQLSPLKAHEEMIAQMSQSHIVNEPGFQKKRERTYTQSDVSSQHQYSSLESQTTKALQSPNQLSQFTIPSYSLIQESILSPTAVAGATTVNSLNHQQSLGSIPSQFTQQQQQLLSQQQTSSSSLPSFHQMQSQLSMQNLQLQNEVSLQHVQQQFQINPMLNKQLQHQNFQNMIQNTSLQNPQNGQSLSLQLNRQTNSQSDQIQFMQAQLNLQKLQNQSQSQQLNLDYLKNIQQVTQQNLGLPSIESMASKNHLQYQNISNQMFSQDQMMHQLYSKLPQFQQNQLQRNLSAQLPHQQSINAQNFGLNRIQSTPEIPVSSFSVNFDKGFAAEMSAKNNYSNLSHLENPAFNQFSAPSNDQSSNASSTTTSKNIGNFYLQNQFNMMTNSSTSQPQTPQFLPTIKQEAMNEFTIYNQSDLKNQKPSSFYQNIQSKIEEYEFGQLGNTMNQKLQTGSYTPLITNIPSSSIQSSAMMHKPFQKKEEI